MLLVGDGDGEEDYNSGIHLCCVITSKCTKYCDV